MRAEVEREGFLERFSGGCIFVHATSFFVVASRSSSCKSFSFSKEEHGCGDRRSGALFVACACASYVAGPAGASGWCLLLVYIDYVSTGTLYCRSTLISSSQTFNHVALVGVFWVFRRIFL